MHLFKSEWLREPPRARVGSYAGPAYGTRYVQDNQEFLMARAWEQLPAIEEANRLRRIAELAAVAADALRKRHIETLSPGELIGVASPARARTRLANGITLRQAVATSPLPNAAATLLVLAALATGREVIISRGELVEIGGGFRVPDVLAQSGAVLREIGTTNRTRAADYAAAISDRTALILRVHPSNFRIEGFTQRPSLAELVDVGRRFDLPVVEDAGSGYLSGPLKSADAALRDEPIISQSIAEGTGVVMFSGDKLLGGPQAGIIVGRNALLTRIRTHPLMRALRVDKMTYAALEATLEEYAADRAQSTVPVAAMIAMPLAAIERRARALADALGAIGIHARVVDGESTIGGGSAPGSTLPTKLVAIEDPSPQQIEKRLREYEVPIIARIDNDRVLLDLRTVDPSDDKVLIAASSAIK